MQPNPFQPNEYNQAPVRDTVIDTGLQEFMRKVLNTMAVGLGITGLVAWATANFEPLANLIFGTPLYWVAMLAPLGFIFFGFNAKAMATKTAAQLQTRFYIFAAVFGLSLASVFIVFTGASVARVFFIAAAMFAGTSLWGYTTKKDLTGWGSFLMMGLWGLLLAMLGNIIATAFFGVQSELIHYVISGVGVLVFTGLIAYETQMLKSVYYHMRDRETADKMAIFGALSLFISFINLFQFLLAFLGDRN